MFEPLGSFFSQDTEAWHATILFWMAVIAAFAFMLFQRKGRSQRLHDRLRALKLSEEVEACEASTVRSPPLLLSLGERLLDRLRLVRAERNDSTDTFALKIWQAGFYGSSAPAWWLVTHTALVLVGAGIGALLMVYLIDHPFTKTIGGLLGVLIGSFFGFLTPLLYRQNRTERRLVSLRKGWPDFLDLLALTVGAGLTLQTALHRIQILLQGKYPDLSHELKVLTAELTYFGEQFRALQALSKRCGLVEVDDLVAALVQAERKGLPLNTLLIAMARDQRRKRRLEIEKKAASLPAKLTIPMITFFLPALLIVILAPVAFRLGEIF